MDYKILIIKNRFKKSLNFKEGLDWFAQHTPLKITVDEMETDINFTFTQVGNETYKGGVPAFPNQHLLPLVPQGKYNAVVIVSDKDNTNNLIRVSIAYNTPLYPDTDIIYLAQTNKGGRTLNHELIHCFFHNLRRKGINLSDPMDTYLRDNELAVDKGVTNRTMALDLLKPYWKRICEPVTIIDKIKTVVTPSKPPVPNEPKPVWRYFKPTEKTGRKNDTQFGTVQELQFELVNFIDEVRHKAGFPMKINSGLRSPEYNKKIGGAINSSHITAWAVDVQVSNTSQADTLIRTCYEVEKQFYKEKRLQIGVDCKSGKSGFVHIGLDPKKQGGLFWTY